MEEIGAPATMKPPPPPPTHLTDTEYVDNLRIVVAATLTQLLEHPETLTLVRQGTLGVIIHSEGVDLIRRHDLIEEAGERFAHEVEEALRKGMGEREN